MTADRNSRVLPGLVLFALLTLWVVPSLAMAALLASKWTEADRIPSEQAAQGRAHARA